MEIFITTMTSKQYSFSTYANYGSREGFKIHLNVIFKRKTSAIKTKNKITI
jgi:hypothetical protein